MPPDLKAKFLCYGSQKKCPEKLVNVSGMQYNTRMTTKWFKYTWVCNSECDALIEYTFRSGYTPNVIDITCMCGSNTTLLSVDDATITPTNEREQMETATTNYDANILVTYKDIVDGVATYPTLKVNELEWKLERIKRLEQQLEISNGQIRQILDNLSADGWYNPNYEKAEVLNDLCEILGHEPKQTVTIDATISVQITYDIPMDEVEDFDARYFLDDNLTIDSYHGDVVVESWNVDDHEVNWS